MNTKTTISSIEETLTPPAEAVKTDWVNVKNAANSAVLATLNQANSESIDTVLMKCSFSPIQLDPRPNAANPEVQFGVEITMAWYENITNLDHHRPGDTSATPSSAEQALSCELPQTGITIATVRPDADSLTAMAVLHLRMNNTAFIESLVREVGEFDRLGPSVGEMSSSISAIWELASDFSKDMETRVLYIAKILAGKISEKELMEFASKRIQKLEDARKNSKVELYDAGELKIAFVESSHRFATNLGYELAPVVVAKNPVMPVDFKDPSKGTYVKYTICRYDSNVACDIARILKQLQQKEAGWGGRGDIIGSSQGVSSALDSETVLEMVQYYAATDIKKLGENGEYRTDLQNFIETLPEDVKTIFQQAEFTVENEGPESGTFTKLITWIHQAIEYGIFISPNEDSAFARITMSDPDMDASFSLSISTNGLSQSASYAEFVINGNKTVFLR